MRCWSISSFLPLRVLVLGGTGHLGAAIARSFADDGHIVTATGRTDRARPNLEGTAVEVLWGDDHDAETINRWIASAQLVIDAATPYPVWLHERSQKKAASEARARTRGILAATRKAGADFIHISSFTTLPRKRGFLGQIKQGMMEGAHAYFHLKSDVEQEVLSALISGQRGCVINPATCFGPYDLKAPNQTFIPMLLKGQVRALVNAELNIVDVRDVGAVALAAFKAGYPDRQIPLFGQNTTLDAFAQQICARRNAAPPRIKVPATLGLTGLYWAETAFAMTGRRTPWPSLPMMLLEASYAASPSPAQHRLCPELRPLDQTIEEAITWYEGIGYI